MSDSNAYPGHRLGLAASGPGSLAGIWRRVAAIAIDWALASFISFAFFKLENLATLLIFGLTQWLFVATVGNSVGHRIMRIKVQRLDGAPWVGFWKSLIRVSLILLVLPPTIWDADGRGLHDKAAGTVLVRF